MGEGIHPAQRETAPWKQGVTLAAWRKWDLDAQSEAHYSKVTKAQRENAPVNSTNIQHPRRRSLAE